MSIIISKKSGFLTEKRIFEILPLFFAITVVTFPRLPGLLNNTTTILAFDTVAKLLWLSQEIFSHLSGASWYDVSVSQSSVWTATPIPAVDPT